MKKIVTTLLLFLSATHAFSQWNSQSPTLTQKQGVYDLRIAPSNNQTAWAICNKYTVQNTAFVQSSTNNQLMITRTKDGGTTWAGIASPIGLGLLASNISPVSDSTAWISLISGNAGINSFVYKTTDGGSTWIEQLQNGFATNIGYVDLVYFWNDQVGIAMGDPTPSPSSTNPYFEIWRTVNGGQNWTRLPSTAPLLSQGNEAGFSGHSSYDVVANTIWFETVDVTNFPTLKGKRLLRSKDAGQTWEAFPFNDLYGISFADTLNGIALKGNPWIGESQVNTPIFRTSDGGVTWQQSGFINAPMTTSVELVPSSLYLIATTRQNNFGPYSTQVSHDWGTTWTVISTNDEFVGSMAFSNPQIGYASDLQRVASKPFNMYKYSGNPLTGIFSNNELIAEISFNPNPTSDLVSIDLKLAVLSDFVLLVNDVNGRLVYSGKYNEGTTNTMINLQNHPSGLYFLTVSTKDGYLTRKIIKN